MPRPRRVHVEGALYYITVRGGAAQTLFLDRQDLEVYLAFLAEFKAKHRFKLYAYALQPDQLHLCLELLDGVPLSEIMHALNTRYSKYHGKRYRQQGHLYQERYRAVLIEKAPHLLPLIRYVHAQERSLATSLPDYLRQMTGQSAELVNAAEALASAEGRRVASPESLVLAVSPGEQAYWRAALRSPWVGSPEFVARCRPLGRRRRWGFRRFAAAAAILMACRLSGTGVRAEELATTEEGTVEYKTVVGELSSVSGQAIAVEYSKTKSESYEIVLPVTEATRLVRIQRVSDLKPGDRVEVAYEQRVKDNDRGERRVLATVAKEIRLLKPAPTGGTLLSEDGEDHGR